MYYLVVILFAVGWILFSIVYNFISTKTAFSHKYLIHGIIVCQWESVLMFLMYYLIIISVFNAKHSSFYLSITNITKPFLHERSGPFFCFFVSTAPLRRSDKMLNLNLLSNKLTNSALFAIKKKWVFRAETPASGWGLENIAQMK